MATLPPSMRACDRCHAVKERCRWDSHEPACERCARLKHDCKLRRPLQKVGRKSRFRRLIILNGPVKLPLDHEHASSSGDDSSSFTDQSSISCPPQARPPARFSPDECIQQAVSIFGCLAPLDQDLLRNCIGAQGAVGRFTIGPSFHRRHQCAIMTQLYSAFPQLKDAFLSCAPLLASQQRAHLPDATRKYCYNKAAMAVSSLRSFQVHRRQDVAVSLSLGVAILTFALCVSGGEIITLARHALSLIKPFYESGARFDADETAFLICLIYSESAECLYRGQLPTLKFRCEAADGMVDRYMGLCFPLLSQLYDICEINLALSNACENEVSEIMESLESVEQMVQRWQPSPPSDFLDQYQHVEVVNMLAQARAFRLAILLVIHRLRYPYGVQDDKGTSMANEIVMELDLALQITDHSVKCTDFCLIVASLEQVEEGERMKAMGRFDRLEYSLSNFKNIIKQRLQRFWAARDDIYGLYWYHLRRYWYENSPC